MTAPARQLSILHVLDALDLGGKERIAVELANLLDPDEFRVALCATRHLGVMADEVRPGVEVTVLGRRGRWDLRGPARLIRLCRRRRVDVVHSHGRGAATLVGLCRAMRLVPARHLFHDHSVDRSAGTGIALRLAARFGVDAYVGVARTGCRWAVSSLGLAEAKVHFIRNGIDLGRFAAGGPSLRAGLGGDERTFLLVMVAGLRPEKDHPTLLRAVAASHERHRIRLLLVGPVFGAHRGYHLRCRNLVDELGLSAQVRFLGARTDVPAVLAASDAGVLTSRIESGPLALAEYMMAGLPWIVTDTGEVTAAVRSSGTGLVVPVGDVEALSAAIDQLVGADPAERRAMGARGRALASEELDQRQAVDAVAVLYRQLAGARHPVRSGSC